MYNSKELQRIIKKAFPSIREQDVELRLDFNAERKAWIMDIKHKGNRFITHLKANEAATSMTRECIKLGTYISEFLSNINAGQSMARTK